MNPKSLSVKSFGNSSGNSFIPCVLLILTLRFTCGEKKIWQSNKSSQNIMSMVVLYLLGWLKPVLYQLNLLFIFWAVSPTCSKEHLLQVIRKITFGKLQSTYVVPIGTTKLNILLLNVRTTLSLKTKLDLQKQPAEVFYDKSCSGLQLC